MAEITDHGPQRDLLLYRIGGGASSGDDRSEIFKLYNLLVTGATRGLLANSARAGLGTHVPLGPSLKGEGLYRQALRVYSCFDRALAAALHEPASWPLPASLALIAGRFPSPFIAQRIDHRQAITLRRSAGGPYGKQTLCPTCGARPPGLRQALSRFHDIAKALAPQLEPFSFCGLRDEDCWVDERTRTISFGRQLRQQLWRGTANKLEKIARDGSADDIGAKLTAMIGAFAPLCTVFFARFDEAAPHRSYTRLVVYLPGYHTLTAPDDDPERWSIEMGLPRLALRAPVQIQTAEITHLSYLQELRPTERQNQAIRLELRRDFDTDEVSTEISFGRLFDGSQDELYAFDTADHRDALYVTYRASLPVEEDDASAARPLKEAFNRAFGWFEIDARIHQLTLKLSHAGETEEETLLRPRFCLEDSKLSFRVHRHSDRLLERMWLRAAGFEVADAADERGLVHCWRDFRTWEQLRDELLTPRLERRSALLREGEILSRLVGMAAREVIERSIVNIEDAIDAEIARIVTDYLHRYQRARTILCDRLNDELF